MTMYTKISPLKSDEPDDARIAPVKISFIN